MIIFERHLCFTKITTYASVDRFDFEVFKCAVDSYWSLVDKDGHIDLEKIKNTR